MLNSIKGFFSKSVKECGDFVKLKACLVSWGRW